MIWQVALLIVALTFMFVNVWSVILNIKILNKTLPLFDRMLTFSEKWMDQMEEDFDKKSEQIKGEVRYVIEKG